MKLTDFKNYVGLYEAQIIDSNQKDIGKCRILLRVDDFNPNITRHFVWINFHETSIDSIYVGTCISVDEAKSAAASWLRNFKE